MSAAARAMAPVPARMPASPPAPGPAPASGSVQAVAARERGAGPRQRAGRASVQLARLVFATLVIALPARANQVFVPVPSGFPAGMSHDLPVLGIDVLAGLTVALWVAGRVLAPRRIELGPVGLAVPAVALLLLAWLTLPFSVAPGMSLASAIRLALAIALAVYVRNEVDGLSSLAVPLGAMLVIHAGIAIGQAILQGPIGLFALQEARLDPSAVGTSVVTLADGSRFLRAYGLASHPNVLGGMLGCGAILLLGTRPASPAARLVTRAIVAIAAVGLLVTLSRGAVLGTGIGIVAGLVLLRGHGLGTDRRWWLSAAAGAVLVATLAAWPMQDALLSRTSVGPGTTPTEQRSLDERAAQIELGLRVAAERPLIGTGLGVVGISMAAADPAFPFAYHPPHVVLLTALAELGVGGFLAELALVVVPWLLLARRRRPMTVELAAASAALLAISVASLFDYYPWYGGQGRLLSWTVVGIWAMTYGRAEASIRHG